MTRRGRLWLGSALTGVMCLMLVVPAPLARAAVAATASVSPHIQYLDDAAGISFRFNLRNTGAVGDRIGSVRITRPSAQWTVAACPVAPAGWTSTAAPAACTFDSAAGPGDDIPPGATDTFRVKARTLPGSANVTAAWVVKVDPDDAFGVGGNSVTARGQGGGLRTTAYAWQVLNAVVGLGSPPAAGAPCPAAVRTASAGSSRVIVICGKNRANVGLTPKAANSSLAGTFIAAPGTFASGPVGAESASSVVLATWSNTTISSPDGTGKTVNAKIGSGASATSPTTKLTGYAVWSGWPKFHYDLGGSGSNPSETAITKNNVAGLVTKWKDTMGFGDVFSSAAVVGGVAYVGDVDGNLYAFDSTGVTGCSGGPKVCAPLWTGTTTSTVDSSPAVSKGVVYVGSTDGKLYAFDAAGVQNCSGSPKVCTALWKGSAGTSVDSSPAVSDGVVYVRSKDGKVYAFDADGCSGLNCAPLWTAATGACSSSCYSSPAIEGGVLYVGSYDHKLYAFDAAGQTNCSGTPKKCTPLWTATTGDQIDSSPSVVGGTVYIGSGDGKLYAYDADGVTGCSGTPTTCDPLWTAATGGYVFGSPAVANGVVYVGAGFHKLYAFDAKGVTGCSGAPKTCEPLWTAATSGNLDSSPAVAGGVVFVGSEDHHLYAFDAAGGSAQCSGIPKTCTPLWTGTTADEISGSPAVVDGIVYVGSSDAFLYAFGLP